MHLDFAFAQVEQALGPREIAEAAELIGRGSGLGSGFGTGSKIPLSRTSVSLSSVLSGVLDVGVEAASLRRKAGARKGSRPTLTRRRGTGTQRK